MYSYSFALKLTFVLIVSQPCFGESRELFQFGYLRQVLLGLIQLCCCLNSSQTVRENERPNLTCQEIVGTLFAFNSTQKGERKKKSERDGTEELGIDNLSSR